MLKILNFRIALILFCTALIIYVTADDSEICKIDTVSDLRADSPLILCGSEATSKLIYPLPVDPKTLIFLKDQEFKLFCPHTLSRDDSQIGGIVNLLGPGDFRYSITQTAFSVTCKGKNNFQVDNREESFLFRDYKCETTSGPLIQAHGRCGTGGTLLKIAYQVESRRSLDIINLCHNTAKAKTHWARAIIKPIKTSYCNLQIDDKPYKKGPFYIPDNMYNADDPFLDKNQNARFTKLLGKEYTPAGTCTRDYVTKTELISHQDLFYRNERAATQFFVNLVPVWERLRRGTWSFIEGYIRDLAEYKRHELEIWAGSIGKGYFDRLDQGKKYISLLDDEKLPVPDIVYKCAIDNQLQQGMCFLVVNNIDIDKRTIALQDRCEIYDLCNKNIFKIDEPNSEGYGFCCTPSKFYEKYKSELGLEGFDAYKEFDSMDLFHPSDRTPITPPTN